MTALDNVKAASFTREWWVDFIKKNQNFTETCVIKDAISPELIGILNEGVLEVLRERLTHKDISAGIRVYLEGVEQKKAYFEELYSNPPAEDEDIIDYAKRTFEGKFGIIINYGEKHSDLISSNIRKCVDPLIDLVGLPPLGLEITIFIGNYGWTPLGIHQDLRGENVLHFHLGPGEKTMYTWEDDVYRKLVGKNVSNNKNIEPILEHAKDYPFGTGDLYSMPWFKHHVGYSGELSVGVTLWFNNPTKFSYANQMIDSIKHQFLKKEKGIIPNQMNYLESEQSFNDILSILQLDEDLRDYSFTDMLKFTQEEFKYCLMSNGGWQNVPLSLDKKKGYKIEEYEELIDKTILSKEPFKVLYKVKGDSLLVYSRGSKIRLKYFDELTEIINKINSYRQIVIRDLLNSFSDNFPKAAGLYFISLLLNKRGVELAN